VAGFFSSGIAWPAPYDSPRLLETPADSLAVNRVPGPGPSDHGPRARYRAPPAGRSSCSWPAARAPPAGSWPLAVCFSARCLFVDRYTNTGLAALVAAGLVLAGLVLVDLVLAGLVLAGLVLAGLVLAGLVAVDLVLAGLVPRSMARGPCSLSKCSPPWGPKNGPGRGLRWL